MIFENNFSTLSAGGCLISNNKKIFIIREFNQIKNLKLVISQAKKRYLG